jgi:DNA repair protein RadD
MNGQLFERTFSYAEAAFPPPRPFQGIAHEKLRAGLRAKHLRQLLVAPTGSGKTYLGLKVCYEALLKKRRALFVCDRTALIDQTSARADEYGLRDHGIVQANHWRRDNQLPFQIASVQTIQARGYWPEADVIVIDEAHTQYKTTREKLAITPAAVVGLTATPCSKGLGLSYTNMVNAATMHELTESGVLVPMRILTCVSPDMRGAATSSGEWTDKAASDAELQIIGDVVAEWQKHGENRKTIAFGADIAYCTELVKRFNQAGIPTAAYTSETPDGERQELLDDYRKADPRIRILVSVEALAKGFDVQDVGCIIDARPLRKSLSTAIQMWGRGLRSFPGKTDCILLDHSGNIRRFLEDYTEVYFNGFQSLDAAEKLDGTVRKEDDFTPRGCPKCGYKPFLRRCMGCGFEKQTQTLTAEAAGEMTEILIGKKVAAADKQHLWQQLCHYAQGAAKPQGRAAHLFKDITGKWPPRDWHIESTQAAQPTAATLNKIRQLTIAFHRRRAA